MTYLISASTSQPYAGVSSRLYIVRLIHMDARIKYCTCVV